MKTFNVLQSFICLFLMAEQDKLKKKNNCNCSDILRAEIDIIDTYVICIFTLIDM
jgi:hypothetical protein